MRGLALSRWHWLVAFIIVTNVPSTLADGPLFQQFFPGWDGLIHKFLKENCTDDLDEYNKNPMGQGKWDVIDCLFDGPFTETRKAEAAAAALTPGLAPMVLQTIGPNTSETSLLFLRRPLLALLLAISSPWPRNPDDNAIYENPSVDYPVWPAIDNEPARIVVVLVEYVVAMGAAANVALLAYQLGHWSFFMSANSVNDPVWWTYCSFLIHLIGILGIFFRFQVGDSKGVFDHKDETAGNGWFARWCFREFRPATYNYNNENDNNGDNDHNDDEKCSSCCNKNKNNNRNHNNDDSYCCCYCNRNNSKAGLQLKERESKYWILLSVLATWALSIAPTLQVLMGTIMLSGSLLTNQADARNCLFRYVCSAIAARALLSYELAYVTRHVEHRGAKSWVKEGTRNGTGLSDSLFHG
ncbi:hypothetical protein GQ607_011392 [Colletotrichum asianum]|uniref:Uncharacterized protein n=1 Tax=Colletotrichum asianum TaxID=702518 RepID=A0A8H3W796_9PEZI|nr:hypothetical protein GQ607_011392 [Colletotrichum asianum]